MPDGIVDRASEVWEPLLTVADLAQGDWPQMARDACTYLCTKTIERRDSLGVRLLSDLKKIFGGEDKLRTAEIVRRLTTDAELVEPLLDDDAPWTVINHGKPLTALTLARLLKPYGVKPTKIRTTGDKPFQGYYADVLNDAQTRYTLTSGNAEQAEQTEHQDNVAAIVPIVPAVLDSQGIESNEGTHSDGELTI